MSGDFVCLHFTFGISFWVTGFYYTLISFFKYFFSVICIHVCETNKYKSKKKQKHSATFCSYCLPAQWQQAIQCSYAISKGLYYIYIHCSSNASSCMRESIELFRLHKRTQLSRVWYRKHGNLFSAVENDVLQCTKACVQYADIWEAQLVVADLALHEDESLKTRTKFSHLKVLGTR